MLALVAEYQERAGLTPQTSQVAIEHLGPADPTAEGRLPDSWVGPDNLPLANRVMASARHCGHGGMLGDLVMASESTGIAQGRCRNVSQ